MGCRSDYMEPTGREKEHSRVLGFLDELKTGKLDPRHLDGYHPSAYNQHNTQDELDADTAELCKKLKKIDMSSVSLELQIWKRDHDAGEARRAQEDKEAKEDEKTRKAALKKLSKKEREVLGLD